MKKSILIVAVLATLSTFTANAQDVSVDEILDNYFEITGGKENWQNLKGLKTNMKMSGNGMEFPMEVVQLSSGKQYSKITFQGNGIMQGVYDGEVLWSTNFQAMKAEKADDEMLQNFKLDLNDFPSPLLGYKEKGYTVELLGTETMEGTETYKLRVIKEPKMENGTEKEDLSFYYFDTESFVLLAMEMEIQMGPQGGGMALITMSDYQEVDGFYFPFSTTRGLKGGPKQPMTIESIEVNPEVDESVFTFPEN